MAPLLPRSTSFRSPFLISPFFSRNVALLPFFLLFQLIPLPCLFPLFDVLTRYFSHYLLLLRVFLFLIIYITHLPATSSSLVSFHISNLSITCTSIRPTSVSHSPPLFLSVKLFNFSSTFPPLPPVSFTTHSSHLYIPHSTLSPFPFHPSFSNPSSAIPSSTAYTHPLLIFHASSHPAASSLFFARSLLLLLLLLPRHSLPDLSSHPFPSLLLASTLCSSYPPSISDLRYEIRLPSG